MKTYIGIDPGQKGAIAIISPDYVFVWDYDDLDYLRVLRIICAEALPGHAVIEKVHSMPAQGVASSFKFGMNYGIWQGRLEAFKIPYDLVTPQKWQKQIFDSAPKGDRKAMSLDRARRLFPQMISELTRKKDHGRSDALLLAEYSRRQDK